MLHMLLMCAVRAGILFSIQNASLSLFHLCSGASWGGRVEDGNKRLSTAQFQELLK